jgi:hypothetical protein
MILWFSGIILKLKWKSKQFGFVIEEPLLLSGKRSWRMRPEPGSRG